MSKGPVDVVAEVLQRICGIDGPVQDRSRYRAREVLDALAVAGFPARGVSCRCVSDGVHPRRAAKCPIGDHQRRYGTPDRRIITHTDREAANDAPRYR